MGTQSRRERRLAIRRETLRVLSTRDLLAAAGGGRGPVFDLKRGKQHDDSAECDTLSQTSKLC